MVYNMLLFYVLLGLTVASVLVVVLVLHKIDFILGKIEIDTKKRWPRLPQYIIRTIYYLFILLLVCPIFFISFICYQGSRVFSSFTNYFSIGLGCLLIFVYSCSIGFISWIKSFWSINWLHKSSFVVCVISCLALITAMDYCDPYFDYETHTVSWFLVNSIFMTLAQFSFSARKAVNLHALHKNYLSYEKKIKDILPQKPEISLEEPQKNEEEKIEEISKEEIKKEENVEEQPREIAVNMIQMSLVCSHVSMQSGEKSHTGQIPEAFPDLPSDALTMRAKASDTNNPVLQSVDYKNQLQEILDMTMQGNGSYQLIKSFAYITVAIVYLAAYELIYRLNAEKDYLIIGAIQLCFLVAFDIL